MQQLWTAALLLSAAVIVSVALGVVFASLDPKDPEE